MVFRVRVVPRWRLSGWPALRRGAVYRPDDCVVGTRRTRRARPLVAVCHVIADLYSWYCRLAVRRLLLYWLPSYRFVYLSVPAWFIFGNNNHQRLIYFFEPAKKVRVRNTTSAAGEGAEQLLKMSKNRTSYLSGSGCASS